MNVNTAWDSLVNILHPSLTSDHDRLTGTLDQVNGDVPLQIEFDGLTEAAYGCFEVLSAGGIHGFHNQESILRRLPEHRPLTIPPIPATADSTGFIGVDHLSRQSGFIFHVSQGDEGFAAFGSCQSQIATELIQVLASAGQAIIQRNRIIQIHQGIDGRDPLPFFSSFEERFDG